LKELAGLKNLQGLDLGVTKVTDAGMKELAALKGLRWLKLPATQITDAGLKGVSACKSLKTLNLAATQVSDTGLKEQGLNGLRGGFVRVHLVGAFHRARLPGFVWFVPAAVGSSHRATA
jgi:hypothetical protein